MRADLAIFGDSTAAARYVSWAPVEASVRLSETGGVTNAVRIRLRNRGKGRGGQVVFRPLVDSIPTDELRLDLPVDGTPVPFFVAGQFGRPSRTDGDAAIEVVAADTSDVLATVPLMVRVRKNANDLTVSERDRFLSALATLNDRGLGRYSDFRSIHTNAGSSEAHGLDGFLPWHRAFILDLERELQAIDASVALPYWRFDMPAPKLFTRSFIGVSSDATGLVEFSADNPLQFWATDGQPGIARRPRFKTQSGTPSLFNEVDTLALGGFGDLYANFVAMEGNPHGSAHVGFTGYLSSIDTAVRDPLFFLLHANVDRMWAKWQWFKKRFDTSSESSYSYLGSAGDSGSTNIGHNLLDSMWPWNGVTGSPRPPTAPGGPFPPSGLANQPGATPTIGSMIDYQGVRTPASRLGFDYDDVPFER